MRLSYIAVVAAVAVVATLDATSAATATTLSKPNLANVVSAHEIIKPERRFLRSRNIFDEGDDDEEGRGFFGQIKAGKVLVKLGLAQTSDDVFEVLSSVRDPDTLKTLFNNLKPKLAKQFDDFDENMSVNSFYTMIKKSTMSEDEQLALLSAYSKYRHVMDE